MNKQKILSAHKNGSRTEYINPDGIIKNPASSQIETTNGNGKTIYIGGQNSVKNKLEIIGKDDILVQTEQVMNNLKTALKSCGAGFNNLVKLNNYSFIKTIEL